MSVLELRLRGFPTLKAGSGERRFVVAQGVEAETVQQH